MGGNSVELKQYGGNVHADSRGHGLDGTDDSRDMQNLGYEPELQVSTTHSTSQTQLGSVCNLIELFRGNSDFGAWLASLAQS